MNWIVAAGAIVTALDLPQRARQLRGATARERLLVALGLAVAAVALASVATPLLDTLDISAPTMEVGAGLVLVICSLVAVVRWDDEPVTSAGAGGLVPLLFPMLLTPAVGVVLVAVAARNGMSVALVPTIAAAVPIAWMPAAGPLASRPLRLLSATLGMVIGVVMIVDGTLAV